MCDVCVQKSGAFEEMLNYSMKISSAGVRACEVCVRDSTGDAQLKYELNESSGGLGACVSEVCVHNCRRCSAQS